MRINEEMKRLEQRIKQLEDLAKTRQLTPKEQEELNQLKREQREQREQDRIDKKDAQEYAERIRQEEEEQEQLEREQREQDRIGEQKLPKHQKQDRRIENITEDINYLVSDSIPDNYNDFNTDGFEDFHSRVLKKFPYLKNIIVSKEDISDYFKGILATIIAENYNKDFTVLMGQVIDLVRMFSYFGDEKFHREYFYKLPYVFVETEVISKDIYDQYIKEKEKERIARTEVVKEIIADVKSIVQKKASEEIKSIIEEKGEEFDTLEGKVIAFMGDVSSTKLGKEYETRRKNHRKNYRIFLGVFVVLLGFSGWGIIKFAIPFLEGDKSILSHAIEFLPAYVLALWVLVFLNKTVNQEKKLEQIYEHKSVVAKTYIGLKEELGKVTDDELSNKLKTSLLEEMIKTNAKDPSEMLDSGSNHPLAELYKLINKNNVADLLNTDVSKALFKIEGKDKTSK